MKFNMTDRKVERPTCTQIRVRKADDDDTTPDDAECYSDEDIAAYNRGDWRYIGIYTTVTVLVPLGGASFVLEFDGPGCWGIESNSGNTYLQEIGDDQIHEVRIVLAALGIFHSAAEIKEG